MENSIDLKRVNLFNSKTYWTQNGSGMKAMTAPRLCAEICRARNIFFLSRSTKRCNSIFFSLYHLQIVLLTIAYTKIHYFYRNNDFDGDLKGVRGMKAPAAPCRATCVSGILPYFFNSR